MVVQGLEEVGILLVEQELGVQHLVLVVVVLRAVQQGVQLEEQEGHCYLVVCSAQQPVLAVVG